MKKITTITSIYKGEKYLEFHFKNILSFTNIFEIKSILIFNSPSDKEKQIALFYKNMNPDIFKLIFLNNVVEPISKTLNRGFKIADTDFVAYLDVDDERLPDSFERNRIALENNPKADITYGDILLVPNQGERNGIYRKRPEFSKKLFSSDCYFGSTHFYRKNLFKRIGFWDEQLKYAADYEFQVRATLAGIISVKTPGLINYYENNTVGASNNYLALVERAFIDKRYANFHLINYKHLKNAKDLIEDEILFNNQYHNIRQFIKKYDNYITSRHYLIKKGKIRHIYRNLVLIPIKKIIRSIYWLIKHFIQESFLYSINQQRKK